MTEQTTSTEGRPTVIIVGGGLAGLAAAAALGSSGVSVTLLESRPRLGGRASSFIDKETGQAIDNCQHVVMGCCSNFHHFAKLVGIDDLFYTAYKLFFIAKDGQENSFHASGLPAPLHLAGAFRKLTYLSWRDLWSIARALKALAREDFSSSTKVGANRARSFADWLKEQRQSQHVIDHFWYVVLVSALSESLDRIDCHYARKVFVDGFLGSRRGWEVFIPTVPLDQLYGSAMQTSFENWPIDIRLKCGVQNIEPTASGVTAALRSGERLHAQHLVLAVPFHSVTSLLADNESTASLRSELAGADKMESAPISSVHLWFDRPITTLRHAVLVDRTSQWLFNRTALHGERTNLRDGYYYQVVISDSRAALADGHAGIVDHVVKELAEIWPKTRPPNLLHSRVVTEHRAVYSPTPGIDDLRPAQQSSVPHIQFAGDWTSTGWPATMESAVKSGYLAAENILRSLGQTPSFVQADPPYSWLSRLLFRLKRR